MLGLLRKLLKVAGIVAAVAEMALQALGNRKTDEPPSP